MTDVSTRFLRYVSFDTMSDPNSPSYPSTPGQLTFAQSLRQECEAIGLQNARITDKGFVFATLPSNTEKKVPALGFIAHMDTAPDLTGKNVRPQIVRNYDGGDIVLNPEKHIVLPASQFPGLQELKGKDIITTDGTTLLGADDKAGIAEILCAVEYLMEHPDIPHGDIHVGFTPDEEIGRGTDGFDVADFGADYAYTLDGGSIGEIEYENFNACNAKVTVHGTSIHPGGAKGRMVHALLIAMELQQMLPAFQSPMCTEEREGFFHLTTLSGDVETAKMTYIIRDHDRTLFQQKKALLEKVAAFLNEKYGPGTIDLQLEDNYYNMMEQILPHRHLIDIASQVITDEGFTPIHPPVRGGTDGARLSFQGLPCPNLGTGGGNGHGRYEYCCIQSMESAVRICVGIARAYATRES